MPGRDLPDLEERLRRLPGALAVEAPAGLAERVAHRGRRRRRVRRATAAAVVVALLGGAVGIRSAVLDRTPAPVLRPGLLVQDATPEQLAGGRWQALPPMPAQPPGQRPARRNGAAVVEPFEGAVYDPATDRWLRLPARPDPRGTPPLDAGDPERGLLWQVERDSGAAQLYVRVPAGPPAGP